MFGIVHQYSHENLADDTLSFISSYIFFFRIIIVYCHQGSNIYFHNYWKNSINTQIDQGFPMSKELKDFLNPKGIATSCSSPYNPQGNSQVER